ncbi:MAG TPA: glycosyltransferase family 2 protein [Stellaceae bacterium]|nr:glycosyltransferase family 2 protein [Stellaceae bacterium]
MQQLYSPARAGRPARPAPRAVSGEPRLAVLIPCYNEAAAIETVVRDFRRALPAAEIYVYDNNSTDDTAARAAAAGAIVQRETLQGKGNVVRRMFADIDADAYVLVDGDATYDAEDAPAMIDVLLHDRLDMVNGTRVSDRPGAYRPGHRFGNVVLTSLVRAAFGAGLRDMLSGYKVLSHRLVKSMPLLSEGFEIETELAVHALSLRMPIAEVATRYRERPAGSLSKLSTVKDGIRIARAIVMLVKEERPLSFFSALALLLAAASLALAAPVVATYLDTGLVPRLPTAVLASAVMLLSFLSLACGLILDTVTRGRKEMKRIAYLAAGARRLPLLEAPMASHP